MFWRHEAMGTRRFEEAVGKVPQKHSVALDLGETALRLGVAAMCGAVIGLNRDLAMKPTGVRTPSLVALGAAIVTVATITVPGMSENSDAKFRRDEPRRRGAHSRHHCGHQLHRGWDHANILLRGTATACGHTRVI